MQSLNSLHPWCVRSCHRHTWSMHGIMCWHWGPGQVSSSEWMWVVCSWIQETTQISFHLSIQILFTNQFRTNPVVTPGPVERASQKTVQSTRECGPASGTCPAGPSHSTKPKLRPLTAPARGTGRGCCTGLGEGQGSRSGTGGSHTAQAHTECSCLWHPPTLPEESHFSGRKEGKEKWGFLSLFSWPTGTVR